MTPWLTWDQHPAPHSQADLPVAGGGVHQVDDVAVGLPRHHHFVHRDELISGPQPPVTLCRGVLDDGPDHDLLKSGQG